MKKIVFWVYILGLQCASAFAQTEVNDSIEGSYYDLDDLVVTADAPIVKTDGATLTYNLDEDESAKGSSLLDAIKKVPMVTVDGDDNIRIKGQGNFKIYVNGKEDPSLTANYKNVFKAMPANAVSKVEVITEPGAKYDAEGTAGIINLVTITKNNTDGYSGSLSTGFSKDNSTLSAYGRMRRGRLALSAGADYANGNLFKSENNSESFTERFNASDDRYQKSFIDQKFGYDFADARFDASYDLSDLDLVTANFNFNLLDASLANSRANTMTYNADYVMTSFLNRRLSAEIGNLSLSAGASWQHTLDSIGSNIVLSYLYNHGYNRMTTTYNLVETDISTASPYQSDRQHLYNNEHTLQLDFTKNFSLDHTLEAGAKTVFRRNSSNSSLLEGDSQQSAESMADDLSILDQIQDIYAAYVSWNSKFGPVTARAGVRYEHTRMGIDFHSGRYEDFMNHLNDVVPNAAVAYNFSPMSNLRLAYQMRISRPSLDQVNPYKWSIMPDYVRTGNPDLESERSNRASLTYSNFGRIFGGNIGVEYNLTDNAISSYVHMIDNVTYETYANIGHNRQFALSGLLTCSPAKDLQIMVNARLTNDRLKAHYPDISNGGWSLNYTANLNYSIPGICKINAYGGQTTRSYTLNGYYNGWYYYGLTLSRSFLPNDALTLSLRANNFLQSGITFKSVNQTADMRQEFKNFNRNWSVGISATWTFGNLNSDVKKTASRIDNNDKASTSGNSSGIGL